MDPQNLNISVLFFDDILYQWDNFEKGAILDAEAVELNFQNLQATALVQRLFQVAYVILLQLCLDFFLTFLEIAVARALQKKLLDGFGFDGNHQIAEIIHKHFEFAGLEVTCISVQFVYLVVLHHL